MEKADLKGYCEFASRLENYSIDIGPADLLKAMDESAIHTFGWPIGVVLHREGMAPNPNNEGITATVDTGRHFDFWTLKKNGDFYFLKDLFEDQRRENCIFLDTRTIRTAEIFYRTGQLYKALGVSEKNEIECQIEYGGLKNRILTVASSNRHLIERKCTGDVITKSFKGPIESFIEISTLKETVYEVIKSITEMCEYFIPEKTVIDQMVEDYILNGKVR